MGLARALGLNLRKDAFSEQNLKSREHLTSIKEKLIFAFWKKLNEENKDVTPAISEQTSLDVELDGETIDSTSNVNQNTPKQK